MSLQLLIVEDDLDLAATMSDYVVLEGMANDHATNGRAGLHMARGRHYDVIILDVAMPKGDDEALRRIKRASTNMQRLTETLLWLSREKTSDMESKSVSLDNLVDSLLEDNAQLLDGKNVKVEFTRADITLQAPETLCRIAISNLIRNAYQYTDDGIVVIETSPGMFKIRNQDANLEGPLPQTEADRGYGLGQLLVEKIIDRMGWRGVNHSIPGGREAIIIF